MLAILGTKFSLDLLDVQGREASTRATLNSGLVSDDLCAQRLGEASDWLSKITLEELHDGGWEVKRIGPCKDVLLRELVGGHPLGEVTDNLR